MIYHRWSTPIEHSSNHIGMKPIQDHLLTHYNVPNTIGDNYNIFDDESKPIEDYPTEDLKRSNRRPVGITWKT